MKPELYIANDRMCTFEIWADEPPELLVLLIVAEDVGLGSESSS